MNTNELTKPENLEKYSFLWSEARLLIAAVALFAGGVPPIRLLLRFSAFYGVVSTLLGLAWIISGIAAVYLAWRWYESDKKIFGGKDTRDLVAFAVCVVSGINLGIVGVAGINIGMSIIFNRTVFAIVGIIYIAAAFHLWQKWNARGNKLF